MLKMILTGIITFSLITKNVRNPRPAEREMKQEF